MTSLHTIPLTFNDGTATDFGRFKGNAVLVVNVASVCGFTRQYAGLEELYVAYRGRGLCEKSFGVTFPLAAKANVRGKGQHPLYSELTKFKKSILPGTVKWNFEKFLVNRDGEVVGRSASAVDPASPELRQAIEAVIA